MQKSSMLEKQVVIIIPTHNRQHCLGRLIDYYRNWDCRFLLVDSSANRFDGDLPSQFGYLHLPGKSFYEKIQVALVGVREPFVGLCADDDVFSMQGFHRCLQELAGGGCGICNGAIAKFYPEEFGKFYFLKPGSTDIRHFPKGAKEPRLLADYSQVLWSIYERTLLGEIIALLAEIKPRNDNYIELIIATVGQYRAGVTVLPELFLIREISPTLSWGATTIPLGAELGNKPELERKRITEKVATTVSGCPAKEDFDAYLKSQPTGFISYVKFRLYQRLAKSQKFGWHGSRETNGCKKIAWNS